jgi:hypothetical protein
VEDEGEEEEEEGEEEEEEVDEVDAGRPKKTVIIEKRGEWGGERGGYHN